MPTTRSSNKAANFKVYYSANVPQQKYFPHRKKTVRRPDPPQDGQEKKQMTFLPEKMRRQAVIDSDQEVSDGIVEEVEGDNGLESVGHTPRNKGKTLTKRGQKRRSGVMRQDSEDEDDTIPSTTKRRKNAALQTRRRSAVHVESESQDTHSDQDDSARRRRRQSTMTQIVDGRRPIPGAKEPNFKPVKRSPRTSWGGKDDKKGSGKDGQQRTLTQMVPDLMPLGIMSDDDLEEELEDIEAEARESQEYNDSMATRLVSQDLLDDGDDSSTAIPPSHGVDSQRDLLTSADQTTRANQLSKEDEAEYHPTQHIDAPAINRTRKSRRSTVRQEGAPTDGGMEKIKRSKPRKTRFSLLTTPEKRRVFEIASSQSPPESPLSTQVTPQRSNRSPLKNRSVNALNAPETPSKRKQVTFQEPGKEHALPSTSLRKFASVIQDSEDEDEGVIENSEVEFAEAHIGPTTQAVQCRIDEQGAGLSIGEETQAMLLSIDRACADAEDDTTLPPREPSEELDEPIEREESQELGEPIVSEEVQDENNISRAHSSMYLYAHNGIKQEAFDAITISALPPHSTPPSHQKPRASLSEDAESSPINASPRQSSLELPGSTPPQQDIELDGSAPATPMVIRDDDSSDDEEPAPTPPHSTSVPAVVSTSGPLVGLLGSTHDQTGQALHSPSARPQTQQSYSSKAEEQLHSEHQSYSQFHAGPPASSMRVAYEPGFSYQETPFPPHRPTQAQHSGHLSQATTIDPSQPSPRTTPRKARLQPIRSATTTPRKISSSQPFISPNKPPPLVIPSSFPSPCRTVMEGWSSPVMGRTTNGNGKGYSQWGGSASIENFSIPAPPPVEMDDDDDDEEEL